MNHEQEKLKNSTRRYRDEVAVKKQLRIAKKQYYIDPAHVSLLKEPHRMHKRHAMDCGNPKCMICGNPRKNKSLNFMESLSIQERRFFQDMDNMRDKHSNGLNHN